ncbi:MAG: hypothetical protein II333_00695 [Clostridia bacterium]|nr:hypothetical protein [Clostridia bacterium]
MSKFIREREPTLLPAVTSEKVGRCAVCGKPVFAEERVVSLDNGAMVHEECAIFRRESLTEFLDLLGLDYYTGTAKEMVEDV